jgi:hypothetical protein
LASNSLCISSDQLHDEKPTEDEDEDEDVDEEETWLKRRPDVESMSEEMRSIDDDEEAAETDTSVLRLRCACELLVLRAGTDGCSGRSDDGSEVRTVRCLEGRNSDLNLVESRRSEVRDLEEADDDDDDSELPDMNDSTLSSADQDDANCV